ncbi:ASCH domain-containing protein [Nitratireductor pacificus]|uniref:ASCH domain-containing protein n=1 Tax=Nitratireductor pacificus pht-3B TaxID=391937 RepID=K2MTJ4_9HYPH|nr:ASCH domain-containing protein [Nitratireductor pacificus]EKF20652.1 hypothetical protein NA2_02669 [Nitratireductor pacificus pht-3B]
MQFKRAVLEGIASGEITLAFRRWKKPTIMAGSRLRTALGVVRISGVAPVAETQLDEPMAKNAGFPSLAALKDDLRDGAERSLYRIDIDGIEADGRVSLRQDDELDADALAALAQRLARWDAAAGSEGYHLGILARIAEAPASAAALLAEGLGVEKLKFKRDVRKLKELGLTESLDTGYRLSPRGEKALRLLGGDRS